MRDRLVTCEEWLAFMADGGYHPAELWVADGWATVQREGGGGPGYWHPPRSRGAAPRHSPTTGLGRPRPSGPAPPGRARSPRRLPPPSRSQSTTLQLPSDYSITRNPGLFAELSEVLGPAAVV